MPRLRGQAGVCKFLIKCACNTDVNYTDTIIRNVLARDISDPEIQLDLLGDKNQDMTLEEVTQFVEAKDSGKRSASRLLDSQVVQATSSSYKKAKQTAVRDKHEICSYCGKRDTAKVHQLVSVSQIAYGHKCGYCNREHHFKKVCRSKEKSKTGITTHNTNDCEGAVFDALCSISSHSQQRNSRTLAIEHHLYDNLSDTWVRKTTTICQPCYKNLTGGLRSIWFQHYYKNKYYCNLCYGGYGMPELPCRYQGHPSTGNKSE